MIKKIDHLVITTSNITACLEFYSLLGFETKKAGERYELFAGDFKINVHVRGKELHPHAKNIQTGSVDVCFEYYGDLKRFKKELQEKEIVMELGIVDRNGVKGKMSSIYLRDPDGNLIEFCSYE